MLEKQVDRQKDDVKAKKSGLRKEQANEQMIISRGFFFLIVEETIILSLLIYGI